MGNEQSQTSNPQTVGPANLQTTVNQTVAGINNLDSGSQAIALSGIANTTTTTAAPVAPPPMAHNWLAYGGIGLLVAIFLGVVTASLLKQH